MSVWTLYFLLMLPNISNMIIILCVVFGIWTAAYIASMFMRFDTSCSNSYESWKELNKNYHCYWKMSVLASITFVLITIVNIIPNTYQLVALYVVPKVLENADVQQIPGNLSKLINKEIVSLIDEIDNKKSNTKESKKDESKKDPDQKEKIALDAAQLVIDNIRKDKP